MKSRKQQQQQDARLRELPPELRRFDPADWWRASDPPPWDPAKLVTCQEHGRHGCITHSPEIQPVMWTADKRDSEYHGRWWHALEAWAWKHGLTVDDVLEVLQAAEGDPFPG
jgi:hypothetical protein